jgi:hypothetical protein
MIIFLVNNFNNDLDSISINWSQPYQEILQTDISGKKISNIREAYLTNDFTLRKNKFRQKKNTKLILLLLLLSKATPIDSEYLIGEYVILTKQLNENRWLLKQQLEELLMRPPRTTLPRPETTLPKPETSLPTPAENESGGKRRRTKRRQRKTMQQKKRTTFKR